ncbi:MAG: class I SAM-dependent methyltransferase [Burkholderiales bacterium]
MSTAAERAAQVPGFVLFTWPFPALLVWAAAWAIHLTMIGSGAPPWAAGTVASCASALAALRAATPWRRRFIAVGFPLSWLAASCAFALPAWVWLLPMALLAALYPLRSWRDAPLFPTPTGALSGLAKSAPLPATARIVDLGCGVGDGLRELRREYPQALIGGIEWSWPLRWICALRCGDSSVSRGDIWAADWSAYDLVYLFQRPESMARAATKAEAELRLGAWLVSLEFEAVGLVPQARLSGIDGRHVWLYQTPFVRS